MKKRSVGVLALQGAFSKHAAVIDSLGVTPILVRKPSELEECDSLIIPGGESTTMSSRIDFIGLREPLLDFSKTKPIFGTCAGLILMSKTCHDPLVSCFGILDIEVERNAFGRQSESFSTDIEIAFAEKKKQLHAIFIRAPKITKTSEDVKILASFNGEPILIQQGHHLGATFHPELSEDSSVHYYFLSIL